MRVAAQGNIPLRALLEEHAKAKDSWPVHYPEDRAARARGDVQKHVSAENLSGVL